jgi:hypothetical protein
MPIARHHQFASSGLITLDFQFNQPGCYETSSDFFSLLSNNALLLGACLLPIITVMPLMMLMAFLRASKAEKIATIAALNIPAAFLSSLRIGSLRRESSETLASAAVLDFPSARSGSKAHSSEREQAGKAPSAFQETQEAAEIELCGAGQSTSSGETPQSCAPNDRPRAQIADASICSPPLSPSRPTVAHRLGGLAGAEMLEHTGELTVAIPGTPELPMRPLTPTEKPVLLTPRVDPKLHRKLQKGMTFAMPKTLEHSADDATQFHYW